MDRQIETSDRRESAVSRRRVLAAVGASGVAGIAGCSGGGGSNGGSGGGGGSGGSNDGGDSGGETGSAVADPCSALGSSTVAYDTGATPLIADFEMPAMFEGRVQRRPTGVHLAAKVPVQVSDTATMNLTVIQISDQERVRQEPREIAPEDAAATTEFGGETVGFTKQPAPGDLAVKTEGLSGTLPHDVAGTTIYFPTNVKVAYGAPNQDSIADGCESAIDDAAAAVVASLTPNPETTIAEWIDEHWENPP